jgi:hypothetical protein
MKRSFVAMGSALALLFGIALPALSFAQGPTVINVLSINDNGDQPGLLDIVKRVRAINERLGNKGTSRVWQATLAGEGTNAIFVAIEHPSLVSMAQDNAKLQADAEWQKIVDEFEKKGMSVLSNSVSVEITP